MAAVLYCLVEGHGEVESIGILVRRIAIHEELLPTPVVVPSRISKHSLVRPGEFEKALEFARMKVGHAARVLVLLDADDECPVVLASALAARASIATDLVVSVVIAKREYEAWFLAGAHSLRGARGLRADLEPPLEPEEINGAKEWLTQRMDRPQSYSPPIDQPALTERVSLLAARSSPSFDKCYREIVRLLRP